MVLISSIAEAQIAQWEEYKIIYNFIKYISPIFLKLPMILKQG